VRRLLPLSLLLAASLPLFAIEVDPKLDRAVRAAMPVCGAEVKYSYDELPFKLPPRFTGAVVRAESSRETCNTQLAVVLSPANGFFLGMPWYIGEEEGKTIEEKLKNFAWRNMQENLTVTVDRTPNEDGLWPVTLESATENGKQPMKGTVDPQGKVYFFGTFRRAGGDIPAERAAAFAKLAAISPAKGPADAPVTIVEFSDFQCPSCKHASTYADAVLAKHEGKVRYIRFDLPLTGHAWAFPASLAGRAIWRQKPEAFWEYKKAVYEDQDRMNTFMFWDWARGFAEDHGLDLQRYDADLASAEIKTDLLTGAGLAFTNDVRATPTYMVNGTMVEYGENGADLEKYVAGLLAK
jgi:protein-disulfide isomerase